MNFVRLERKNGRGPFYDGFGSIRNSAILEWMEELFMFIPSPDSKMEDLMDRYPGKYKFAFTKFGFTRARRLYTGKDLFQDLVSSNLVLISVTGGSVASDHIQAMYLPSAVRSMKMNKIDFEVM